jgi:hypothetical protein
MRRLVPKEALAIFLGNTVFYASKFPPIILRVGGQDILVINKKNNAVTISAKFYSRDKKIVAELKENKFFINPNNYFRVEYPDESSLIVYDQEGIQILNVDYLNKTAIKLLGTIYIPNRDTIVIGEEAQKFGNMNFSNCSFYNNGVDISLQ